MALTAQQSNYISELQQWADQMLALRQRGQALLARWNINQFIQKLDDDDVSVQFPHLTAGNVTDAVTAMQAVLNALGDDSGGQAVNLYRTKG